jgi:methyl-accepting chemotaxis protein
MFELLSDIEKDLIQNTHNDTKIQQICSEIKTSTDALRQHLDTTQDMANVLHFLAEQTQLLAVNATFETVRLGANAVGFIFIAQELSNLANQTTQSMQMVQKRINHARSCLENTRETFANAPQLFQDTDQRHNNMTRVIEQIKLAQSSFKFTAYDYLNHIVIFQNSRLKLLKNVDHLTVLNHHAQTLSQDIKTAFEEMNKTLPHILSEATHDAEQRASNRYGANISVHIDYQGISSNRAYFG